MLRFWPCGQGSDFNNSLCVWPRDFFPHIWRNKEKNNPRRIQLIPLMTFVLKLKLNFGQKYFTILTEIEWIDNLNFFSICTTVEIKGQNLAKKKKKMNCHEKHNGKRCLLSQPKNQSNIWVSVYHFAQNYIVWVTSGDVTKETKIFQMFSNK